MSKSIEPKRKNVRHRALHPINAEDFFSRVQKPVGCWLYDGCKETNGYGYLANPFPDGPKFITAHRLAWIFTHGPIPEGMRVLHRCDVRACMNPEHLFLGTDADNCADKMVKNRQTRGEAAFKAKLTEVQVLEIRRDYKKTGSRTGNGAELARKYGVCLTSIHAVVKRISWAHLK